MRRVALVSLSDAEVRRVVLHEGGSGVHLYLSRATEDRGCFADEWYETVADAETACSERFGIDATMWREVPDPAPGCQHDWIAPVRVMGRDEGKPRWGELEQLLGSKWVRLMREPE